MTWEILTKTNKQRYEVDFQKPNISGSTNPIFECASGLEKTSPKIQIGGKTDVEKPSLATSGNSNSCLARCGGGVGGVEWGRMKRGGGMVGCHVQPTTPKQTWQWYIVIIFVSPCLCCLP